MPEHAIKRSGIDEGGIITVSPSTLQYDFKRCPRCFWLKVQRGLSPPSAFFPPLFNQIHSWIYEYLQSADPSDIVPDMPAGRLIHIERGVKSQPIHGRIALHGRFDGLIALDSGGHCIMDIKTVAADKVHRLADNYRLQLNVYAYCLEHPAEGAFTVSPVTQLGILAFLPDRFAVKHRDAAGIAGSLRWVDVPKDDRVIGKVLGDVLPLLRQETPPLSGEHCEWCAWFKRRQMLAS